MRKNKKITAKQIKLIINVISLTIFIVSYFYVYETYVDKTDAVNSEMLNRKAEITNREKMLAEEENVREQIEEVSLQKQAIIDSFPVYIGDEDNFMFVDQMESALNVKTASINSADPEVVFETILPIVQGESDKEAANSQTMKDGNEEKPSVMIATANTLSMSFVTNYRGFKNMADYISNYPDHTIIESVAVSSDNTTGLLTGNLILRRFALSGTGKEYEVPSIEGIDIGIDNIFGSDTSQELDPKQELDPTQDLDPTQE